MALVPTFAFFGVHRSYPSLDAAEYMLVAQRIWLASKSQSFWQTLSNLYWDRVWKPILQPVIEFGFLTLAGGDVRLATALCGIIMLTGLLAYVYLLARLFLVVGSSLLVMMFIGTLPWVLKIAWIPQTELTFALAFLGAVFHFIGSDEFRNRRHAFAFAGWAAIAICVRPDMSLLSVIPLYFFGLARLVRSDGGTRGAFWSFAPLYIFVFITALVPIVSGEEHSLFAIFGLSFAVIPIVMFQAVFPWMRPIRWSTFFLGVLPALVPFAFYLPFARKAFRWMWLCSFGEMAQRTGRLAANDLLVFRAAREHWFHLLPIAALTVAVLIARRNDLAERFRSSSRFRVLISLSAGIFGLAFFIGLISYTIEIRYLIAFEIAAAVALFIAGFQIGSRRARVALAGALSVSIVLQIALVLVSSKIATPRPKGFAKIFNRRAYVPVRVDRIDTTKRFIREVGRFFSPGEPARLLVFARRSPLSFDEWRMTVSARDKNLKLEFSEPRVPSDYLGPGLNIHYVANTACHLIVGPVEGVPSKIWNAHHWRAGEELIEESGRDYLRAKNWQTFEKFAVKLRRKTYHFWFYSRGSGCKAGSI